MKTYSKSFYKKQFNLLALFALLLWLLFDFTNLDLYLSQMFFDAQSSAWPYYDTFWTKQVGYLWPKYALILYGLSLMCLLVLSFKNSYWQAKRMTIVFLLLSIILVPTEISLLKHTFHKPRPEQIVEFGGIMQHVKLLEFTQDQPSASNWPGGHASGGAALVSLYFIGKQASKFWGKAGLAFGVLSSQIMGFVQVLRGQHFLSHNLWTLWFAWLTVVIIYFLLFDNKSFAKIKTNYFKVYGKSSQTYRELDSSNSSA